MVGKRAARVRRPDAARVGEILDRDRNAAKWAVREGVERLFAPGRDEGVQLGLDALEPAERRLDELRGRHLAGANSRSERDGVVHD